jgi:hypothetical protein
MQNNNKLPSSLSDFVQLAQHAFAQARANFERARILTEMGETYLEKARLAERNASEVPDSLIPPVKGRHKARHARQ